MAHLPQVIQQTGCRVDYIPAAVLPASVRPPVLVIVTGLALDQNHVEVLLRSHQPLGQNTTVTLIHKQQNPSCPAASEVDQQLIDQVSLLQISLRRGSGIETNVVYFSTTDIF